MIAGDHDDLISLNREEDDVLGLRLRAKVEQVVHVWVRSLFSASSQGIAVVGSAS